MTISNCNCKYYMRFGEFYPAMLNMNCVLVEIGGGAHAGMHSAMH